MCDDQKKFNFVGKRLFLTYKSHLDKQKLYEFIHSKNELKYYGICHEVGSTGYNHTHALLWFKDLAHIRNCKRFNYDGIQPNFKPIKSDRQFENTVQYVKKEDESVFGNLPNTACDHELFIKTIEEAGTIGKALRIPDGRVLRNLNFVKEVLRHRDMTHMIDAVSEEELYPWQKEVLHLIRVTGPCTRRILWCANKGHSEGKTAMAKYLCKHFKAIILPNDRNTAPLRVEAYNDSEIFILDVPREESPDLCLLEMLSDQVATTSKYQGVQTFIRAHIVVFTNYLPTDTIPGTHKTFLDRLPNRIWFMDTSKEKEVSTFQLDWPEATPDRGSGGFPPMIVDDS